jgi:glycosyltransferase involved in cell wall biosynthesis
MSNKRILITSPSLNVKENVSGISSLVSDIINCSTLNFIHFQLGSKNGGKKGLYWAFVQIWFYLKIISFSLFRKYEFVHLNMALERFSIIRDSVILFIAKRVFKKKVILHIHGGYYLMHEPQNRVLISLLKTDFKYADAIIVLSGLEKNILAKRYGELAFNIFPNAVNINSVSKLQKPPDYSNIRFVFMARITKVKGIYTITESLQYLSEYFNRFSLDIYGAGEDLEDWLITLKKYPAFKFCYKGVVGGTDKWEAFNRADVLLLPSLSGEGMPIAMIEAMASGCVVIVTDIASIKTIITDNVNGILLPVNSPEELASKMKAIIGRKFDLKSIGQNAKDYVEANLSLSNYVNKLENLYATL